MPTATMMVGNIGSGKSTLAAKLARRDNSVVLNMDSLQQMIGGGDYGRYDKEKKEVYRESEQAILETALDKGLSVVIDRTNMTAETRKNYIELVRLYTDQIICYDFGAGNEYTLRKRLDNPLGVPVTQWRDVHLRFHSTYERPNADEGFTSILKPPRYNFHAFDFDGTIVGNNFPEIGEVIDGTVERMNDLYADLSNIIIIWTCRSGDFVSQMKAFLQKSKIPFDYINENPLVSYGSPKIFAHRYYDDRNIQLPLNAIEKKEGQP